MKNLSILFIAFLFTQFTLFAQQDFWNQTNGPPAGFYHGPVMNSSGVIFTVARDGYAYRSTDHGLNWEELKNGLDKIDYLSIAINQKDYIFVGATFGGGIFRSTDNGENWSKTSFPYFGPNDIEIDTSGNLLVSTYDDCLGIFRSTDDGETWSAIGPVTGHRLECLAVSNSGTIFTSVADLGLYRSTDNGTNWTLVFPNINPHINGIAFNSKDHVYILDNWTYGLPSLYLSTNNGENWATITSCPPLPEEGSNYNAIILDSADNVFIGGSRAYANISPGAYRSTDSCLTWTKISDLDCYNFFIDENQHLLMASPNCGILQSSDMGNSWQYTAPSLSRVRSISLSQSDLLVAGLDYFNTTWGGTLNNGGVFYSMNEGSTWVPVGLYEKSIQTVYAAESTSILAGTSNGVYYLSDLDSSWIPSGLPNTSVLCLEGRPDGNIFAGTGNSGLYRSTDNGASWTYVGLMNTSIRSLLTVDLQTIYAGTENEGIYKSVDGGISWSFSGLPNTTVTSLSTNYAHILAGTNSGIYNSSDNGISWAYTGLNHHIIQDVIITSNNSFSAATSDSGIYFSSNSGQSWTQLNNGLNHLNVTSLLIDNDGYFYAGTDLGGVYKSIGSVLAVENENTLHPIAFQLIQNYPNPFNPSTTIQYSIKERTSVELVLYDILGREVEVLVNEDQDAGQYKINLNAGGLASGIYFYKIQAGEYTEVKKMMLLK
jgi:photosystem II stability/assembly factor-like uncharacterized protein